MYALLVSPNADREGIAAGKQTASIRLDYRSGYEKGAPLMLVCHLEPWAVKAEITSRRHCRLYDVEDSEARAAGFANCGEMFKVLQTYYAKLNWNSPVTVISWKNVQGKLVNDLKKRDKKPVR